MKVLLEPEPPEWEPLTPPGAEPPEDEHDPQMGLDL